MEKWRRKASGKTQSEGVSEDETQMETVESRQMKRKSTKYYSSKSGSLLGGRELRWRKLTPVSDNLLLGSEEGGYGSLVLAAKDVAARGLDVPGIRTVVHYQLPHSAELLSSKLMFADLRPRIGRTVRASKDLISIALASPADPAKYSTLCRSLSRAEVLQPFPVNLAYLPAIETRVSLALKVEKLLWKQSQSKATEAWLARNAEAMEIETEVSKDEDGLSTSLAGIKQNSKMGSSSQLRVLQKELQDCQPIKPKAFSNRYIIRTAMTPLVTKQLQTYMLVKAGAQGSTPKNGELVVIGQEQMEPLEALRLSSATRHVERNRY